MAMASACMQGVAQGAILTQSFDFSTRLEGATGQVVDNPIHKEMKSFEGFDRSLGFLEVVRLRVYIKGDPANTCIGSNFPARCSLVPLVSYEGTGALDNVEGYAGATYVVSDFEGVQENIVKKNGIYDPGNPNWQKFFETDDSYIYRYATSSTDVIQFVDDHYGPGNEDAPFIGGINMTLIRDFSVERFLANYEVSYLDFGGSVTLTYKYKPIPEPRGTIPFLLLSFGGIYAVAKRYSRNLQEKKL